MCRCLRDSCALSRWYGQQVAIVFLGMVFLLCSGLYDCCCAALVRVCCLFCCSELHLNTAQQKFCVGLEHALGFCDTTPGATWLAQLWQPLGAKSHAVSENVLHKAAQSNLLQIGFAWISIVILMLSPLHPL